MPNGVDLGVFHQRDQLESRALLGWEGSGPHIMFGGLPRPVKRPGLAQAAVEIARHTHPGVELHLPEEVPHEVVPVWMSAADAMVLTSLHEGSPYLYAQEAQVLTDGYACDDLLQEIQSKPTEASLEAGEGLRSFWPYDGSHVAELPEGCYEASLTDPHLQFVFLHHHTHQQPLNTPPASPGAISFRVTAANANHAPGENRFNYLPHSHAVNKIYTDNTAQAFVGQGSTSDTVFAYDIYTRRRPQLVVRFHETLCIFMFESKHQLPMLLLVSGLERLDGKMGRGLHILAPARYSQA